MAFLSQEQAAPAWFLSLAFLGTLYAAAFSFRFLAYLALCLRRPKDLRRRYGAWAVVTGPTSGIGRSVALELASRGLNLVLVDLNAANLKEISHTVRSRHAVQTKTVVFDLSLVSTAQGDEALRRLREAVAGLDVGVLVNNAGVAKPGAVYLHEADVEACVRLMRVNLWALTEVTAAVLPGMVERGRGAVVNMGSASSEAIPSFPLYTMYAATKRSPGAFTLSTEAKGSMCNARLRSTWRPGWCRFWRRPGGPGASPCSSSPRRPTRTRARRCAGSATARPSAPPTSATSSCGASPPSCRTSSTTGSACASTCSTERWLRERRDVALACQQLSSEFLVFHKPTRSGVRLTELPMN
ncbi:very-long-chain 3-oxoacyl-CoA reductase 1 isoform X1 [Aegilops tauschii subsp. strangulata]|uniref:very-long-chain 3-oxoacyl-CoA reductase 1 isoform X1 n=1 Tax=Aegilops tauschii subsp. strangulata TaxID=200361 RepID=UPI001ABCA87D|nr:very-long-chain 3-oxoacyl-CoA reductase 1 isoform X1 [Aegilops tauschii subsp. strangulata]